MAPVVAALLHPSSFGSPSAQYSCRSGLASGSQVASSWHGESIKLLTGIFDTSSPPSRECWSNWLTVLHIQPGMQRDASIPCKYAFLNNHYIYIYTYIFTYLCTHQYSSPPPKARIAACLSARSAKFISITSSEVLRLVASKNYFELQTTCQAPLY